MHRALSWPLLAGCSPAEDEPTPPVVVVQAVPLATPGQQQQQARRLLCRHYYPEGGWGWVIVFCCASVHLLAGGLQLSWAVLLAPTARKFDTPALHTEPGRKRPLPEGDVRLLSSFQDLTKVGTIKLLGFLIVLLKMRHGLLGGETVATTRPPPHNRVLQSDSGTNLE
ncbi:hypothetical protein FOCC_FOCC011579 [Frankliniella occidentalis]|nr:hypothetical protein FOCC_FOCC011579 [Frankliniella occidentalis]